MRKTLIVAILLLSFQVVFGQSYFELSDTSFTPPPSKSPAYAPYGLAFTPKGEFKVLVIYAGFYSAFWNEQLNCAISNWPEHVLGDDTDHSTVPDYVINGSPTGIFFSSVSEMNDPANANIINLTRYYYDNSHGAFTMLGDVFKDPDPTSSTYGQPIRINIDPSGCHSFMGCNKKVLEKIRDDYGIYWDNIWDPYDNRDNSPTYGFDNSLYNEDNTPASGDGDVDFVIIHWRYSKSWSNQPMDEMSSWSGNGGGVAGLASLSYSNFSVSDGYTITVGGLSELGLVGFMPHEFAHCIYSCPHIMGANSTRGDKFFYPTAGWGMMSSNSHPMLCANGWEAWLLDWIDIDVNSENTDIQSTADLNATGNYTLRDFVTTGDVIRIKIPNSDNNYLWIENH